MQTQQIWAAITFQKVQNEHLVLYNMWCFMRCNSFHHKGTLKIEAGPGLHSLFLLSTQTQTPLSQGSDVFVVAQYTVFPPLKDILLMTTYIMMTYSPWDQHGLCNLLTQAQRLGDDLGQSNISDAIHDSEKVVDV